jgi:peptidoglycan/LPS O-acetylase OafA/YrhL
MTAMLLSHSWFLMLGVTVVLWSERRRGPNPAERVAHPAQAVGLVALAAVVLATSG